MSMYTCTGQSASRATRGLLLLITAGVLLSLSKVGMAQTRMDAPFKPVDSSSLAQLLGGPVGIVKDSKGTPVEGLMVQLISQKSSIRTTVYTNKLGQYEFPKLEAGEYTLRIARPLEFRPYVREGVHIEGAKVLDDIVVEQFAENIIPGVGNFLPPDPQLLTQLTEAEWIANMPGTAQEKKAIVYNCGNACHDLVYLNRVRFNEDSWRKIVDRMTNYRLRILLIPPGHSDMEGGDKEEQELIVGWLAKYRSPDGPEIPPIEPFPRPQGLATRAIVKEYELPWGLNNNIHDVTGDAEGNIWFTPNKTSFIGKLDPKTGEITLYRTPKQPEAKLRYTTADPPGVHPGTHWLDVDEHTGIVWFSDTWAESLGRLDPRSGDVQWVNTGMQGNVALAADGKSIWRTHRHKIKKFDTSTVMKTGQPVKEYELKNVSHTYGNFLSDDGRYFGGGGNEIVWLDIQTGEVREKLDAVLGRSAKGRGDFDQDGNMWMGSRQLMKYDPKLDIITYYSPPTPHVTFYVSSVDKNGDVWAGEMHGGRVARFRPSTEQWIEYQLPSPWSFEYYSWVDDSTSPPTYWYGDNYGYIVSVQPLAE